MILKIRNGHVWNQERLVGTLVDDVTFEEQKAIELGSEAAEAIENVVELQKSGIFKPRATIKTFETLLDKYK